MPERAAGEPAIGVMTCKHSVDFVDLDADAGVAAGRADANVAIFAGIEILRVRIEIADHAAYRAFQQRRIVDRFYIILLDALQHLGKQPRLLPGQLVRSGHWLAYPPGRRRRTG